MDLKKLKILQKLYINGKWTSGVRGKSFDVLNPADESVITKVDEATNEDVDIAVKAAREAFEKGPWSRMNPSERQRCLYKLADLVEQNA
jgi:acyl-CoA reductase-like NAD-dependent aldehyde dehydrogenase